MHTFRLRHDGQACGTCFLFLGNPLFSDATNLTFSGVRAMAEARGADQGVWLPSLPLPNDTITLSNFEKVLRRKSALFKRNAIRL
jgi:hypothetical protein